MRLRAITFATARCGKYDYASVMNRSPKMLNKDAIGGAALFVVSLFFIYGALEYRIGTLRQMGPGFMPLALGIAMCGLSSTIFVLSFKRHDPAPMPDWRPAVFVMTAVAVFGLSIRTLGLLPAVFAAVIVSARAGTTLRFLPSVVLALVLVILSWTIFIVLLGLPIRLWTLPS